MMLGNSITPSLAVLSWPMEKPMEQKNQIEPLSVSVEDAARIVGFSRSSIYELIAKGEVKTFKIGRRRLVLMTELKSWVERAAGVGAR